MNFSLPAWLHPHSVGAVLSLMHLNLSYWRQGERSGPYGQHAEERALLTSIWDIVKSDISPPISIGKLTKCGCISDFKKAKHFILRKGLALSSFKEKSPMWHNMWWKQGEWEMWQEEQCPSKQKTIIRDRSQTDRWKKMLRKCEVIQMKYMTQTMTTLKMLSIVKWFWPLVAYCGCQAYHWSW